MAMFFGSVKGSRGLATRLGTKNSGMTVTNATWQGAIEVNSYEQDGILHYTVILKPWHGKGEYRVIEKGVFHG